MSNQCQRCHNDSIGLTGSYFNEDMICRACQRIEQEHPQYEEAKRLENEEVKKGNTNFPGIGLPDDLGKKHVGCTVEHRMVGGYATCDEDLINDPDWIFVSHKQVVY